MAYQLEQEEATELETAGWRLVSPPLVANPFDDSPWPWDYHMKIAPFNFTLYERILVIDADALVLRPLDLIELLQEEPSPPDVISAVKDCVAPHVRGERVPDLARAAVRHPAACCMRAAKKARWLAHAPTSTATLAWSFPQVLHFAFWKS